MAAISVSTACAGLLTVIAQVTVQISQVVSAVRGARREMDAVSRELTSLALCLEALRDDSRLIKYPEELEQILIALLKNCDAVTWDMLTLLKSLSSDNTDRRTQWTIASRDEISRLRSSLEIHKSAINIAIDVSSILMLEVDNKQRRIPEDNSNIIASSATNMTDIKQVVSDLSQQIATLVLQRANFQENDARGGMLLQRFLDECGAYVKGLEYPQKTAEGENLTRPPMHAPKGCPPRKDVGKTVTLESLPRVERRHHENSLTASPLTKDLAKEWDSRLNSAQISSFASSNSNYTMSSTSESALTAPPESHSTLEVVVLPGPDRASDKELHRHSSALSDLSSQGDTDKYLARTEGSKGLAPTKCPDHQAIEATALARSQLSGKEVKKLDERLQRFITGKRPLLGGGYALGTATEIQTVIDAGADIHLARSEKGKDALSCEIDHKRRPEVVELLLRRGARIDTSCHLAEMSLFQSCTPIIHLLLDYGADPNEWESHEASPLCTAAQYGNTPGAQLLMAYGANPNAASRKCQKGTPLSSACYRLQVETVKTLLQYGADANQTAFNHPNPTQATIEAVKERSASEGDNGRDRLEKILKLLKAHGASDPELDTYLDPYSAATRALIHPWDYSSYLKGVDRERRGLPGPVPGKSSPGGLAVYARPSSTSSGEICWSRSQ